MSIEPVTTSFNIPAGFQQDWSLLPPLPLANTVALVAYNPKGGQFLVLYRNGNFALWLNQPQWVMRGLQVAHDPRRFLHNLGPPTTSNFTP